MDAQRVAEIEAEQVALFHAYKEEPTLAAALDACDSTTTFQQGWTLVSPRFSALRDWAGGLASIFPNTATVESDFSVLGWEKDEYCQSLTDLSLEGIMQSKQYDLLAKIM